MSDKIDLTPIYSAIDDLTDFLLENTENVFEECPEADSARAALQEYAESVERAGMAENKPHRAAMVRKAAESVLSDIDAMRTGAETFGGFVWQFADDSESAIVEWPNLAITADALRESLK